MGNAQQSGVWIDCDGVLRICLRLARTLTDPQIFPLAYRGTFLTYSPAARNARSAFYNLPLTHQRRLILPKSHLQIKPIDFLDPRCDRPIDDSARREAYRDVVADFELVVLGLF